MIGYTAVRNDEYKDVKSEGQTPNLSNSTEREKLTELPDQSSSSSSCLQPQPFPPPHLSSSSQSVPGSEAIVVGQSVGSSVVGVGDGDEGLGVVGSGDIGSVVGSGVNGAGVTVGSSVGSGVVGASVDGAIINWIKEGYIHIILVEVIVTRHMKHKC